MAIKDDLTYPGLDADDLVELVEKIADVNKIMGYAANDPIDPKWLLQEAERLRRIEDVAQRKFDTLKQHVVAAIEAGPVFLKIPCGSIADDITAALLAKFTLEFKDGEGPAFGEEFDPDDFK